jgi:ABC-type glycerol-3-phosphate transport system substrate-binding protein
MWKLKSSAIALIVSLAVFAVACGGGEVKTIIVEKEVPVEVVKEVIVEKEVPVEVVKEVIVEKEVETIVTTIVEVEAAVVEKEPKTIIWWWWGEDNTPGVQDWVDAIVPIYEAENPHITVDAVYNTTDAIVPNTVAAVAAQSGPDIGHYWSTGLLLDDMFAGQFLPIEDLMPETVEHILPFVRDYITYDGHVWGIPNATTGYPWVYNKNLWEEAGLDRDFIPTTWDELLEVGAALNAAGITPMGAGMKDQWWADWPWLMFAPMEVAGEREFIEDYTGISGAKQTDPKYLQVYEKTQELIDANFFSPDVNSMGLIDGWDMIPAGTAAMTMGLDALAIAWERDLGEGNVGVFFTPKYGTGAHGDKYQTGTAYSVIYKWSEVAQEAADFLAFQHRSDIMKLYYELSGVILMDDRFDRDWLDTDVARQLYDWTYDEDMVAQSLYHIAWPTLLDFTWSGAGALFAGEMTALEVAEQAQQVMSDWQNDYPEQVEKYKAWLETSGF